MRLRNSKRGSTLRRRLRPCTKNPGLRSKERARRLSIAFPCSRRKHCRPLPTWLSRRPRPRERNALPVSFRPKSIRPEPPFTGVRLHRVNPSHTALHPWTRPAHARTHAMHTSQNAPPPSCPTPRPLVRDAFRILIVVPCAEGARSAVVAAGFECAQDAREHAIGLARAWAEAGATTGSYLVQYNPEWLH